MTIQRQYSLPNCTLILEGLSDATSNGQPEVRPLMSILVNAECHLAGHGAPLTGGREFFEGLVNTVSRYGQEFLSGVHQPYTQNGQPALVNIQRLDNSLHRLSVRTPEAQAIANSASGVATATQTATRQMDLTTVQLFDLVEAVDQFFADTRTLPDLSLSLAPASKRYVASQEPVAKRAVPAALGVSSLAIAALALFFVPVPEVRRPEESARQLNTSQSTNSRTGSTQGVAAGSGQPDLAELESTLTAAPEITDPAQVDQLGKQLYDRLDQAWTTKPNFSEDLVYQVGVAQDGSLVGYKPVNQPALENSKQTPLLDLLYIPAGGGTVSQEPLARYQVVFTPERNLEVNPWQASATSTPNATTSSPSATPNSSSTTSEITDPDQIRDLTTELYDQIDRTWQSTPSFEQELVFRVAVAENGAIAEYEPINQPAFDYGDETPLGELRQSAADGQSATSTNSQEPLAPFKVVFKPNGVLQVSPWRGYQE